MAISIKISELPQLVEPTTGSLAVMVDSGITHYIVASDLFNNNLDISSNTIHATNNGNGTNFKVGDDMWIGDVNIANTIQLKGLQDGTKAYIKFGSGSNTPIIGYDSQKFILSGSSFELKNKFIVSGSVDISGSTTQYGNNTLIGNNTITGSLLVSGSTTQIGNNTLTGTTTLTGSVLISGSTTQYGNNTLIGNTMLSGSITISGSVTGSLQVDGDINLTSPHNFYRWGNRLFNYANYYNTGSVNLVSGSATTLNYTSDIENGFTLVSGSQIKAAYTGYYNIQYSVQLVKPGTNPADVEIWFSKNGQNIPYTNSVFTIPFKANLIAALNFFVQMNAGDYIELKATTNDSTVDAVTLPANGFKPASPSVVVTVSQIS